MLSGACLCVNSPPPDSCKPGDSAAASTTNDILQVKDWEPKISSIVDWWVATAAAGAARAAGAAETATAECWAQPNLVWMGCGSVKGHYCGAGVSAPAAAALPVTTHTSAVPSTHQTTNRVAPCCGLTAARRFGQLQAVDVAGVPPAVHARDEGNVLRADEPAVYPNRWGGGC